MKTILLSVLFALVTFAPVSAQRTRATAPVLKTNPDIEKVLIWSAWMKNSGYALLEARYAKFDANTITLELRNTGTTPLEGEFTANECPDSKKDISGWKKASIEPGASVKLTFPTSGCNAGFHWWSRNVNVWSSWFNLNPSTFISARWIKRGTEFTIEIINSSDKQMSALFAANFCGDNFKSVNGWHKMQMPPNKTVVLKITDGSAGRCNEGFHLWYKDLRGPQQIDDGTDLIPVDGGE